MASFNTLMNTSVAGRVKIGANKGNIDPGDPLYVPGSQPITVGEMLLGGTPSQTTEQADPAKDVRLANIAARTRQKEGDKGKRPNLGIDTSGAVNDNIERKSLVGATLRKLSSKGY